MHRLRDDFGLCGEAEQRRDEILNYTGVSI